MRTNLLSLQDTQSLMDRTQERLSTGLKVNSAIDNASSYYTAQSLNNRASDLNSLLDSMGQGIQTIKAANEGIEAITEFVEQAKASANSARDEAIKVNRVESETTVSETIAAASTLVFDVKDKDGATVAAASTTATLAVDDTAEEAQAKIVEAMEDYAYIAFDETGKMTITAKAGYTVSLASGTGDFAAAEASEISVAEYNSTREKYAAQFNGILDQIDKLAKDSGYKGINLLQLNDLKVVFNENRTSDVDVTGTDASSKGLGLTSPANAWQTNEDIDSSIIEVDDAISQLRIMASDFGNYYSIVQNRQDFTGELVNVLTEGADNLTLADMNEESANMLALQTRQQLAINSLSLASQAAQSVLKLF